MAGSLLVTGPMPPQGKEGSKVAEQRFKAIGTPPPHPSIYI